MEANTIEPATENQSSPITTAALLDHWQGQRRVTRRVIEAFPEDEFYKFSIGGMRTYAGLTMEMLDLAGPGIKGIATGDWSGNPKFGEEGHTPAPTTKAEVLARWDATTDYINTIWPQIHPDRFQAVEAAFGQYPNVNYGTLLYIIDNEIHHRGQGYVYLRALGIEPPFFWDRS